MVQHPNPPTAGDPAPSFDLPATGGQSIRLEQFSGEKNVVLYFYPKDETAGCTKQACAFRDLSEEFVKADTVILGVSGDDIESHERFASNHGLPFPLLADTEFETSTRYGAYKLRERDGKQFMGIERTTFLIDKQGVVRKVYPQVQVEGHIDEVLRDIAELT
jgi:thioredoxin-dependent peroxiredoxin